MRSDQGGVRPRRHPRAGSAARHRHRAGARHGERRPRPPPTLVDAGVDVCFANPGTSEMHFVAALDDVPAMRGVLCLFEGVATGAADGYGRMAGRPAATLLHLGPGLGNGLANLHNARRARTPDRQHRRRPRDLPRPLRRPAPVGHRVDGRRGVGLVPIGRSGRRRGSRCGGVRGGRARAARLRGHAGPARGRVVVGVRQRSLPATPAWPAVRRAGRHRRGGRQGAAFGRAVGAAPRWRRSLRAAGCTPPAGSPGRPAPACWARPSRPAWNAARASRPWSGWPTWPRSPRPSSTACAHLVLVDAKSPVSFFAYPGKASDLVPPGLHRAHAGSSRRGRAPAR